MLDQELPRILLALTDTLAVIAVPGARLLDNALLRAEVEDLAFSRDAVPIENLELVRSERGRHLVFHHLDPSLVAEHLVTLLDRADAADVQTNRGVELERVAPRRGLRIA